MRFRSEEKKPFNSQNERKVYLFIFVERKKKKRLNMHFIFFLTVFNCTQHRMTKQHRDDLFIDQSYT